MSGDSDVLEHQEGDGQGHADAWRECARRTTCAVFREATDLGRPGASIGSAFAEPMYAFLGTFPVHVYESMAMLLQMVANANKECTG